ncbi:hypothetical protein ACQY0O_002180 [Thecaphora frezii]
MDTVKGDKWVSDYASWIRIHEAKLGDAARKALISTDHRGAGANANVKGNGIASSLWCVVGLGSGGTSVPAPAAGPNGRTPQQAMRPLMLRLNPHYLYYLLIRFEAIGLPVGSLDIHIPTAARPTSYFSFVSASSTKPTDDTMSISSFRSRMSSVSSSLSRASSWWGGSAPVVDPVKDLKYIYAALTKIPSLRLGPIPATKLIEDFEDYPGKSAVPLDVFKNLQMLELEEVDPRTLIGWDRASMQLRSLTCKKSGIEDLTDLVVDLVIQDASRRRGDSQSGAPSRRRHHGVAGPSTETETETEAETNAVAVGGASSLDQERPAEVGSPLPPPELPSLSWHFLRYLNLSNNNLTFVPSMPLRAMEGLTNLDLSSNLLNIVPPALAHLPNLTSLNIQDNLIDSVLGIYGTLKAIRVLNLAKNRLESLCGLERLYTLERIDLRSNCIFEAGEVGRLATLPAIKEVWIKDNPLEDELLDYRLECFVEFAKEGRGIALDGEGPGFFERQRIAEKIPSAVHAVASAGRRSRSVSMAAEEEAQAALEARQSSTVVKAVKHRGSVAQRKGAEKRQGVKQVMSPRPLSQERRGGESGVDSGTEMTQSSKPRSGAKEGGAARRRNRRIVELDSTPKKPSGTDASGAALEPPISEADAIKEAARSGKGSTATPEPPTTSTSTSASASASTSASVSAAPSDAEQGTSGTATARPRPSQSRTSSRQFARPSSMLISSNSEALHGLTSTSRLTWSKKAGEAAASLTMDEPSMSSSASSPPVGQASGSRSAAAGGANPFQTLYAVHPNLASLPSTSSSSSQSDAAAPAAPTATLTSETRRRGNSSSSTVGRSAGRLAFLREASIRGGDSFDSASSSSGGVVDTDSIGRIVEPSEVQATARMRVPRPGTSSAAALARRSRVTASLYEPSSLDLSELAIIPGNRTSPIDVGSRLASPVRMEASRLLPSVAETETGTSAGASAGRSEAFRRRIEALKGEVGDDWLRLLARGADAGYAAQSAVPLAAAPNIDDAGDASDETAAEPTQTNVTRVVKKTERGAKGNRKKPGGAGAGASGGAGGGGGGGKRSKKREAEIE